MTAYGAAVSLQNTIDYILHSSHFTLLEPSRDIIQIVYDELEALQEILQRVSTNKGLSRKKVNALDGRIKDFIWEFEDLLDSLLTDQILLQFQGPPPNQLESTRPVHESRSKFNTQNSSFERDILLFPIHLLPLRDDIDSLVQTLKDIEKEYIYEVENMAEDDEAIPSIIGFHGTNSKMIGLSDQFDELKRDVMRDYNWNTKRMELAGMAGVGKTTLAKEIYQDPEILSHFECRAWVTVGRKPQLDQVSRGILAQLCGDECLEERLEGKKSLIVLDDVWERRVVDSVKSSLPDIKDGYILILVTARATVYAGDQVKIRFLNEEESKDLLCDKVFGDEICPPQLDKAATKIAKKCEGLPLTIVTVADILSKSQNRDPDYWDDVAEERHSVFTDAYDEITKVLFPSYDYLPQYLKMPFLYMGVFPPDYDFPPSKLINMLTAEGWSFDISKKNPLKSLFGVVWTSFVIIDISFYIRKRAFYGMRYCVAACIKLVGFILHGAMYVEEKLGRTSFIAS